MTPVKELERLWDLRKNDRRQEALEGALALYAANGGESETCCLLCLLYFDLKDNKNTLEFGRLAIRHKPRAPLFSMCVALALTRLGRNDEVMAEVDRYLTLSPDDEGHDCLIEEISPYCFSLPKTVVHRIKVNPQLYRLLEIQGGLSPLIFPEASQGQTLKIRAQTTNPAVPEAGEIGLPAPKGHRYGYGQQICLRCHLVRFEIREVARQELADGSYSESITTALRRLADGDISEKAVLEFCMEASNQDKSEVACTLARHLVVWYPGWWFLSKLYAWDLFHTFQSQKAMWEVQRFMSRFPGSTLHDGPIRHIAPWSTYLPPRVVQRIQEKPDFASRYAPGTGVYAGTMRLWPEPEEEDD